MVTNCPDRKSDLGSAQPVFSHGPGQGPGTVGAAPTNSDTGTPSRSAGASVAGREITVNTDGSTDQGSGASGSATLQEQFAAVQTGDGTEMAPRVGDAHVDLSTSNQSGSASAGRE